LARGDAEKIRKIGQAEAEAIAAVGKAQAETMKAKAGAFSGFGHAGVSYRYFSNTTLFYLTL
jgi:flotillin